MKNSPLLSRPAAVAKRKPLSRPLVSEAADVLDALAKRKGISVVDYLRQTLAAIDAPGLRQPIPKPILAVINDRNPDREFTITMTKNEFFPLYGLVNASRNQESGTDDESRDLRRRLKHLVKKLEGSAKQAMATGKH